MESKGRTKSSKLFMEMHHAKSQEVLLSVSQCKISRLRGCKNEFILQRPLTSLSYKKPALIMYFFGKAL